MLYRYLLSLKAYWLRWPSDLFCSTTIGRVFGLEYNPDCKSNTIKGSPLFLNEQCFSFMLNEVILSPSNCICYAMFLVVGLRASSSGLKSWWYCQMVRLSSLFSHLQRVVLYLKVLKNSIHPFFNRLSGGGLQRIPINKKKIIIT